MESFCDSCSRNDAVISCDTCARWYHSECFQQRGGTSNPDGNQCYKCVKFGFKPVQIAEFVKCHDQEGKSKITPKIYSERIARIIKDSNAEDLPVLIISVAGVARSGKSFLLNLMIDRNIHHIERGGTEWTTSKSHISGFNWAQSATAVTFGIWMWEKAIITQLNDGSKVAILYMDTQGTGDRVESTDPAIDTLIMYLSLEISTIQIHNINQVWRIEDTRIYEVCKLYGELCNRAMQKPFNHLILMHRNWQNDDEYGWRPSYYDKEEQNVAKNQEALATLEGIKDSFKTVDFAMLPTPGSNVTTSKKNLSIKDIKIKFLRSLESFFDKLYNQRDSLHDCARRCKRGKDIIRVVMELKARVEEENMPPIRTPAEHMADSINSQAYASAMSQFEVEAKKINPNDGVNNYIRKVEKIVNAAKETFQKMAVKQQQFLQVYRLYEKRLNDDLSTKQAVLVKTVEWVRLQKDAEEMKLQNQLGKMYQEALLSWDYKAKTMEAKENENLAVYKRSLQDLSIEILQKFTVEVEVLGCDDKSLCYQLHQALQGKEHAACKMAENELVVQKIQKDLEEGKMEQERKDREFLDLQRKQKEKEMLSQEQQEKLDNYMQHMDEQKKKNDYLQSQLDEQNRQNEIDRIQAQKEIEDAHKKVECFQRKVTELEDQLDETREKLEKEEELYKNVSSARGATEDSFIDKVAKFAFNALLGWVGTKFPFIAKLL